MGNTTTKIQRKIKALIRAKLLSPCCKRIIIKTNYYTIGKIDYESSQTQNSVILSAVYRADRLNFNSATVV